ncbi:MAG TPA: histidine kinase [Longimicrobium sp.]|jgi:hypothetical protein
MQIADSDPTAELPRTGRLKYVAAVFAGWAAWALFWTTEPLLMTGRLNHVDEAAGWFREALVWALLTFFIFWLARRFPFGRGRRAAALGAHAAGALLVAFAAGNATYAEDRWLLGAETKPYFAEIRKGFRFDLTWYCYVLGIGLALHWHRRARERDRLAARLAIRAADLEAGVAKARLAAARMQVQPQLLFGTLDAVSELAARDPDLADHLTVRLADLLRMTVSHFDVQEVALHVDLAFLDTYLAIQQVRLPGRVAVRREVTPDACEARVPAFLLQPIVASLLHHASADDETRRIDVAAWRDGGRLLLEVRGEGRLPPARSMDGAGLDDVRARLRQLHGADARLEQGADADGAPVLRVSLPYREVEEGAAVEAGV